MNVREALEVSTARNGERTYLRFADEAVAYAEFDRRVNRMANALLSLGISKGDHCAIMLPNSTEFLYAWFGLNKIGAVEVPVNTQLKESEVHYILEHSESVAIIASSEYASLLVSISDALPSMNTIILVGDRTVAGTVAYEDIMTGASEQAPLGIPVAESDPAVIIYTSGTTGRPKGVVLSHRALVETGRSWAYTAAVREKDRIMTPMPLFHANAQVYSTMGSLVANASLILLEKFSRSRVIEQARHFEANRLVIGAPIIPMIWSREPMEDDADNPIEVMQAGGVPKEYSHEFEARFGVRVQTIYSLTESPVCIMGPSDVSRPRKVTPGIGYPMEHPDSDFRNEVKIVNEQGREVPTGAEGQIVVKNPAVMIGYFKDAAHTAEIKCDGWIHTGDVGFRDEDGYFFFMGRQKDVIRRKAELISPTEIEEVINGHPSVEDCAVIGVPSGLGTAEEEIKAYISLRPGSEAKAEEIIDVCYRSLADFKVPRYVEFRQELPRTPLGKVQKAALKSEKKAPGEGCYDREAVE